MNKENLSISKWSFIGDVNPAEHGGVWLRKEDSNNKIFEFVKVGEWSEDKIYISNGVVYVEDSWIDKDAIESYADVSFEEDPESYVCAVISYYAIEDFDQEPIIEEKGPFTDQIIAVHLLKYGIDLYNKD